MKTKILTGISTILLLVILMITQAKTNSGEPVKNMASDETVEDTTDVGTRLNENPWPEVEKLVKAYEYTGGIFYKGSMRLIDGESETEKVLEETNFEYIIFGNQSYYKLGDIESVEKEDIYLVADHQARTIGLSDGFSSKQAKSFFKMSELRKILEQASANIYLSQRGAEKVLTIDSLSDSYLQGYRIFYNPETYVINRILIGMTRTFSLSEDESESSLPEQNEEDISDTSDNSLPIQLFTYYLDLEFSKIEKKNYTKENFKPEDRFVKKEGNSYVLQSAFSTYNLLGSGMDTGQEQMDTLNIEE